MVRRYRCGGVFLSGRTALTPTQLGRRLRVLQSTAPRDDGLPVHVAVDQEGGLVRSLRGTGFSYLPAASDQATWTHRPCPGGPGVSRVNCVRPG